MTSGYRQKNIRRAGLLWIILVLSLFFTVYSEITSASALDAMELCAVSVVPSLFPFMVLSSMASKAAAHLTGKSSARTAVIIPVCLGALCGFPVGAASVASMYKTGAISKSKAEYLSAFCNNTGPAFVIGVIGRTFWGSTEIGIMFYTCQLLSAVVVFGIWRSFFGKRGNLIGSTSAKYTVARTAPQNSANAVDAFCSGFCSSVADSAVSVIQICGYIVFFRVICDTVRFIMPISSVSDIIYTLLSAVLEFTSGANAAAALGGAVGIAVCGFTIGFSGLSVMAQSTGLLSKANLSPTPLFRFKLIIGFVSSFLCFISYRLFDFPEPVFFGTDTPCYKLSPVFSAVILAAAVIAFLSSLIYRRIKRK